jgi:hypothetical protein
LRLTLQLLVGGLQGVDSGLHATVLAGPRPFSLAPDNDNKSRGQKNTERDAHDIEERLVEWEFDVV